MNILLVDPDPLTQRTLSAVVASENQAWELVTASSGEVALRLQELQGCSVVFCEYQLPDGNGAELLERLAARRPHTVRVVLAAKTELDAVQKSLRPMHQYLGKPVDAKAVIAILRKAALVFGRIESVEVLDAICRMNCLPRFPAVAADIQREAESENGSARTIAAALARDAGLAAQVLQLANSPVLGCGKPIVGLDHAVAQLGSGLISCLAVIRSLGDTADLPAIGVWVRQVNQHCLRVATLARQMANLPGIGHHPRLLFSAGLLHDVGKLVLLRSFPDAYPALLQTAGSDPRRLVELERARFKATHAEVGGYLLGIWGLPEPIVEAVTLHHCMTNAIAAPSSPASLVMAADWLASGRRPEELQALLTGDESNAPAADSPAPLIEWMASTDAATMPASV
jgi:putative nucleotidyltransferase with HDIG domain